LIYLFFFFKVPRM